MKNFLFKSFLVLCVTVASFAAGVITIDWAAPDTPSPTQTVPPVKEKHLDVSVPDQPITHVAPRRQRSWLPSISIKGNLSAQSATLMGGTARGYSKGGNWLTAPTRVIFTKWTAPRWLVWLGYGAVLLLGFVAFRAWWLRRQERRRAQAAAAGTTNVTVTVAKKATGNAGTDTATMSGTSRISAGVSQPGQSASPLPKPQKLMMMAKEAAASR